MRIAWIIVFLTGAKSFSQVSDSYLKAQIDSMIQLQMKKDRAAGVAIGIVKDGRVWYNRGYGTKKLNTVQPVDSFTNFHLASISKVFVVTAIMQLVEQGRIKLDDKLLDHIPVTKLKDDRFKAITIQQMLTHTSGFPDVRNYHWARPNNDSLALGNYARKCIETKKLIFDPGSRFEYSNMAFEVLGHVIETISKKPFDAYQYDHILSKAGLDRSNFDYAKIDLSRRSSPHIKLFKKVRVSPVYPYNRQHGPSSTLNSCTYDMCRWILELVRIYDDTTNSYKVVLTRETLMDMWRIKDSSYTLAVPIGLTWYLSSTPLGICALHDGGDLGYMSNLLVFPEQKMGVIMLINGEYPEGLPGLPLHIALLLGDKIKKPPIEHLKLLEGEYFALNPPKGKWKTTFKVMNGELMGQDGSYRYRLIPVGNDVFFNPDDGASIVFDTKDKNAISLLLFGKCKFRKVK